MSIKKLGIILCVFTSVIISIFVVFACVRVNPNLQMKEPTKFILYKNSNTGKTITTQDKNYNRLKEEFEKSFKVSIFNTLVSNKKVGYKPSQDIDNVYPTFSKNSSNVYIEIMYDTVQTIIVENDGNTHAIDYFSLIFEVKNDRGVKEVAIYHSSSNNQKYTISPILVLGKQNKLYNTIFEIA